jgi:hypothetical protein
VSHEHLVILLRKLRPPHFDGFVTFSGFQTKKKARLGGIKPSELFYFVIKERFLPETPELTSLYGKSSALLERRKQFFAMTVNSFCNIASKLFQQYGRIVF